MAVMFIPRRYYPKHRELKCNNCGEEHWKDILNCTKFDDKTIYFKCPRCNHDQQTIIGDMNGHFEKRGK